MSTRERPLLAVLIDADNVPAKYAEPILKEIASIGEPALRRVYGDWSSDRLKSWSQKVVDLGLVAHQETANTKGKNASDIGLVIDAMDILHGGRFGGFVIVSSDSDFTALANRLREDGLEVIGVGEMKAPESLVNVCNRFIFIENIAGDEGSTDAMESPVAKKKTDVGHAAKLIVNAMDRIEQDDDWYHLGRIGQSIQATNPGFDPRTYGHRKLGDLVAQLPRFETKKVGNQLMVRRLD